MELRRLLCCCVCALAAGGCAGMNGVSSLDKFVDEHAPRPFPTALGSGKKNEPAKTTSKQVAAKPPAPNEPPSKQNDVAGTGVQPIQVNETPTLEELSSGRPRADQMRNLPADRVAMRIPEAVVNPPVKESPSRDSSPIQPPPAQTPLANQQPLPPFEYSPEAAHAAQQILSRLSTSSSANEGIDYTSLLQSQIQQAMQNMQGQNLYPPVAPAAPVVPANGQIAQASHTEAAPANTQPPAAKPLTSAEPLEQAAIVRAQYIDSLEQALLKESELTPDQKQRLQQELRLAYLTANRLDEASTVLNGVPEADAESFKHLIFALHHLLPPEGDRRATHRYALSLRSLREAEKELSAVSRLELKNLAFCDSVQQYGWFNEFKKREFAAGQQVILYLEVENATAEKKSADQYETDLQGSYQIFNTANELVGERTLPIDKQTCRNWRRDYFLASASICRTISRPGAIAWNFSSRTIKPIHPAAERSWAKG